jgi:hypothetical protein
VGRHDERRHQAVLRAGREPHGQFHLTGDAGQLAQQCVRCVAAQLVAAFVGAQRHRVGHGDHAAVAVEDGLQHHRLVDVPALDGEVTDRADRPMPGLVVEQPGEH